ncbi:hypothetical protein K3495_g1439 [Podosphaera aphanis]|nr:hypothetical protein K3495_g1439 [Podosphaera aphanis]
MALRAALLARQEGQNIYVLLDNQAAVSAFQAGSSSSCLRLVRIFQDVARKAKAEIIWLPGQSKISGNKEADAEARAALQRLPSSASNSTRSHYSSILASTHAPTAAEFDR